MKTIDRYYQLDKREIAYLRFILEACDGIAQMTTVDKNEGIVVLCTPADCQDAVDEVIQGLSREISIHPYVPGQTAFHECPGKNTGE